MGILRIIARLNIGGPSIQAITLTDRLRAHGYRTTLVHGLEGEREGSMDYLAKQLGVEPLLIRALRRDPSFHDIRALISLARIVRREQPQIVHTHAAKGGTLGRLAAILASIGRHRPILIHTFHGHSLSGYFSSHTTALYRSIERLLARYTDRLIAVSQEVQDDLIAMGIGDRDRFDVVPLGFDLSRFLTHGEPRLRIRTALRDELGIAPDHIVVTLVARLAPIKRVDRFLDAAIRLRDLSDVRFLIVGDGELRGDLMSSPAAHALGNRVIWAGFRNDIDAVCFASDIVTLCSDNEGTPVSLIEASAAALPTISTRVGGAGSVIRDGETGILVSADGESELPNAIRTLVRAPSLRRRMGAAGREHVLATYSLDRLVGDLDGLYRRLLGGRRNLATVG